MIQLSCPGCGKSYSVGEEFAGRQAHCGVCGSVCTVPAAKIVVDLARPSPSAPPPRGTKPPAISPRARRLLADADQMRRVFNNFPLIRVRTVAGEPPELYQIEYYVLGLVRGESGHPVGRNHHIVEIQLTRDYPRQSPKCKMLTPIFHPNIDPTTICVGDHWTASEGLADLVIRIGEMIAYQAYNVKSPRDCDAAMWADLNQHRLPIDARELRPPNME